MKRHVLFLGLALTVGGACVVACGGDDSNPVTPPAQPDSGVDSGHQPNNPDSSTPDHNVPDSNTPDTNVPDTNVPDTNVPDSETKDAPTDSPTDSPTDAPKDAPTDSPTDAPTDAPSTDAADAACNGVELTVMDVDNWCTLSVNGAASFSTGNQTVCVAANSTVNLTAQANTGFTLGDWHHTDGDKDAGDPGTDVDAGGKTQSDATIKVGASGTACVWICCPGSGNPCPTTEQCK
jgi:hypothetical protein